MVDLLDHMRLSKSSLYQTFGGKRSLFLACLEQYYEMTMADMQVRLESCENGLAFVEDMLEMVICETTVDVNPRSCLITNTATEFGQSDSKVAVRVKRGLNGYRKMFRSAAVKGKADGSIDEAWKPDVLADYLVTNMSGLRTMVKAGSDMTTLENMVAIIVDTIR